MPNALIKIFLDTGLDILILVAAFLLVAGISIQMGKASESENIDRNDFSVMWIVALISIIGVLVLSIKL
jgi:hypothetical protein